MYKTSQTILEGQPPNNIDRQSVYYITFTIIDIHRYWTSLPQILMLK